MQYLGLPKKKKKLKRFYVAILKANAFVYRRFKQ